MINPERILVFRKSSLGDVILTLPVLNALMENFPGAEIDYLTKSPYAPVVEFHPAIDRVVAFDKSASFLKAVAGIRDRKYDLLVDLQSNLQSLILASAVRPAVRTKYPKRRLAREIVVRRSRLKLSVPHTVDAYFRALRKIGIESAPSPPALAMPPETVDRARQMMKEALPDSIRTLVALCPGARHYEKRWPHYGALAKLLLERPDTGILVISSVRDNLPGDLGLADDRLCALRDLDILTVAALISQCRAAVSNDSGLMHLAGAVRTPVVAIFGPTNPRLGFSPYGPGSKVICDDVFCSPCSVHGQKKCGQPEKYCFKEVTAERVLGAVLEIINGG